jgi:putative endonuclease
LLVSWFVYVLRCADGSLYTGIAKNVDKRVSEHNSNDTLGAKYTRVRRPVVEVFRHACVDRAHAASLEYRIKQLNKKEKERLLELGYDAVIKQ